MNLKDVLITVEAGGLDYSGANRRKVLGSLRRTATIYGAPPERIPADADLFTKRWGKGKVVTYPIEHFDGREQFRDWRSNVRGAFAQASGAKAAAVVRRATNDGWSQLLDIFDSVAGATVRGDLFNARQRIVLERLADYARREGVASDALTIEDVARFRQVHCVTSGQKAALSRSVGVVDKLRTVPGATHLLPSEPLGQLPQLRLDVTGARRAGMTPEFQRAWNAWRAARQAGTPSALSGSSRGLSDGYIRQFDAAIAWYVGTLAALGQADPSQFTDLRALAKRDWIMAAARAVAGRYDEDGEPVNDDVPPSLSLRSLKIYLKRLRDIFGTLGCDDTESAIAELLEDEKFKGLDGMTPGNIALCRAIVRGPALQVVLFQMPWALQAKAEDLLHRWDSLALGERQAALRAGACAVAMLILVRCAPLRIENLAEISCAGPDRWLSAPRKGALALLDIPKSATKNRKQIRVYLQNDGRKNSWSLVAWYLKHVRPRMSVVGNVSEIAQDNPALFPGVSGAISKATLRDWIKLETAACGLPMRPHQARHAIASILLNRNPKRMAEIAALLGDRWSTVERNYAWLDEEKLVANGQGMIPTASQVLREAARG